MSEIITNKLTGKTSAGDVTITSEGGAVTMQLQQGVAKAWVNFDATGTPAARDSLNFSSITDNSAGDFTLSWSNSMDNGNYSVTGMTENFTISASSNVVLGVKNSTLPASSSVNLTTARAGSSSTAEMSFNSASIFGDLA